MLFVDKEDLASQTALHNLDLALEGSEDRCYVAVLESQYHNAVCISYDITEFPTLLVLDSSAQVLYRENKVRELHEEKFRKILQVIRSYHTTDL